MAANLSSSNLFLSHLTLRFLAAHRVASTRTAATCWAGAVTARCGCGAWRRGAACASSPDTRGRSPVSRCHPAGGSPPPPGRTSGSRSGIWPRGNGSRSVAPLSVADPWNFVTDPGPEWIHGSIPLPHRSGCGSGSCYFRQWPSRHQQNFSLCFLLITFWRYIYTFFKVKKSERSHKTVGIHVFFTTFADPVLWLMDPNPDPRGPKTWILQIRIRSTGSSSIGILIGTGYPLRTILSNPIDWIRLWLESDYFTALQITKWEISSFGELDVPP